MRTVVCSTGPEQLRGNSSYYIVMFCILRKMSGKRKRRVEVGAGDGPGGKKSCPTDREEESDSDGEGEMDGDGSSALLPFTPDFREVSTGLSH